MNTQHKCEPTPPHTESASRNAEKGCVLAPGNYDGVHLGHQTLIARAKVQANRLACPTVAMFFHPHPRTVLHPENEDVGMLTSVNRRSELLRANGVDEVHVVPFDKAFAAQSPEAFVQEVLCRQFRVRSIVTGADFRFGRNRLGNVATLRSMGERLGFAVEVVPPVLQDGFVISSTRIRQSLLLGEVRSAANQLGRVPELEGTVVVGEQRGRRLGFPTANLQLDDGLLVPREGVYAVRTAVSVPNAEVTARESELTYHDGLLHFGARPTFDALPSAEVHLLDFDGDLYGQRVRIGLIGYLREPRRFETSEALITQVRCDINEARKMLSEFPRTLTEWFR